MMIIVLASWNYENYKTYRYMYQNSTVLLHSSLLLLVNSIFYGLKGVEFQLEFASFLHDFISNVLFKEKYYFKRH